MFVLLLSPDAVSALEPEPHPLDTFLTDILNFRKPTGIRGTIRYIDKEEKIFGWIGNNDRTIDRHSTQAGNWCQKAPPF